MNMEIKIYDDGEPPTENLREKLLDLEEELKPSRWDQLLMWFGLKRDERFTKHPWRYP